MQEKHVTPDHYEVTIRMPDTTYRKYLVIASSDEEAKAHIAQMLPEGDVLPKAVHRNELHQTFEVASA